MRAGDRAHDLLRADIVEWRLRPGDLLAEVEQSARLSISRTPLREALARLVSEELAVPHGGRGVVVSRISLDAVVDQIALAVAEGNADLAEACVRVHLHQSLQHLRAQTRPTPDHP